MTRNSSRTKQHVLHRFTKRNMTGVVMTPYGLMGSYFLFGTMFSFLGNALKMALFYAIVQARPISEFEEQPAIGFFITSDYIVRQKNHFLLLLKQRVFNLQITSTIILRTNKEHAKGMKSLLFMNGFFHSASYLSSLLFQIPLLNKTLNSFMEDENHHKMNML